MSEPLIIVDGRGGLPDEITRQLRLAGAPRVQGGPYAADAAEAVLTLSPRERPALLVLVGNRGIATEVTTPWHRAGVTHLPVVCDGRVATIGPLIVPGTGGCWVCHALTAQDIDAADLLRSGRLGVDPVALPPGGLGILTAAVTATVSVAAVGGARLAGVSTEIDADGPSVTHRHWSRHPLCAECGDRRSVPRPVARQETMAG